MNHTYVHVTLEHYDEFIKNNGNNRLDKWFKILPPPSKSNLFGCVEEAFEGIKTNYIISNKNNNYLINFKTLSDTEYRLDVINEPNTRIYHLAFFLAENDTNNMNKYEELTNKGESIELLSRLVWILKDISSKLNISEFCIGSTNIQGKNNIYQTLMKFSKSWQKRSTNIYPPLNWALYFKI